MKTMLLAAYSGYFTSVASEIDKATRKIGPEGDKLIAKKWHKRGY
jgi:hypothetical protein